MKKYDITSLLAKVTTVPENINKNILKTCFSCIDITSLNNTDNANTISAMVQKVNDIENKFAGIENVAAICVYPTMVPVVQKTLKAKNVKIASVAGNFPSSQTFLDIKTAECIAAIKAGANELDIVISLGEFIAGNYDKVAEEISVIKKAVGNVHLKVILETGTLKTPELIYKASYMALEAGADFIKTSTGKTEPAATPEAFLIMALATKDFYEKTRKRTGLKAAGGIVTAQEAYIFYNIIENILGKEYLTPEYFRIGASRLANNLLSDIEESSIKIF